VTSSVSFRTSADRAAAASVACRPRSTSRTASRSPTPASPRTAA